MKKLFYRRFGKGPPLIFLHGLLGMSDNWIAFFDFLKDDFDIIIPDLRNHGKSFHHDEFSVEICSQDVFYLMDELNINSANVIGHSFGGRIAMNLVSKYPDKIQKSIVLDMGINSYISPDMKRIIFEMKNMDLDNFNDRREINQYLISQDLNLLVIAFIMKNIRLGNQRKFEWKPNLSVINRDLIKNSYLDFEQSKKSVLFVKAEKSDYINDKEKLEIKNIFPQSELIIVENAGHWLHLDRGEKVKKIIKTYFEN